MQFDTLFLVHNPSKRAHPQNEIQVPRKAQILDTPCFFTTLSQRNAKNLPRKQHEFQQRHNSLLPRASKTPKTNQNTRISYQTALIDPSHNSKESISFS